MDHTQQLMDEVQLLVWAMVDDMATDEQVRRLEALVTEHAEARRAYVDCMALHAELHCMFAPPKPIQPPTGKPRPAPIVPGALPLSNPNATA